MAFIVDGNVDGTIKVIVRGDSAIEATTSEQYSAYLDSLDESLLVFVPGESPTRFVLKIALKWKQSQKIEASKMKMQIPQIAQAASKGGKRDLADEDIDIGVDLSYINEEVRLALCGIEGPGTFQFEMEKDGGASFELAAKLQLFGVMNTLHAARSRAIVRMGRPRAEVEKNSLPS